MPRSAVIPGGHAKAVRIDAKTYANGLKRPGVAGMAAAHERLSKNGVRYRAAEEAHIRHVLQNAGVWTLDPDAVKSLKNRIEWRRRVTATAGALLFLAVVCTAVSIGRSMEAAGTRGILYAAAIAVTVVALFSSPVAYIALRRFPDKIEIEKYDEGIPGDGIDRMDRIAKTALASSMNISFHIDTLSPFRFLHAEIASKGHGIWDWEKHRIDIAAWRSGRDGKIAEILHEPQPGNRPPTEAGNLVPCAACGVGNNPDARHCQECGQPTPSRRETTGENIGKLATPDVADRT